MVYKKSLQQAEWKFSTARDFTLMISCLQNKKQIHCDSIILQQQFFSFSMVLLFTN